MNTEKVLMSNGTGLTWVDPPVNPNVIAIDPGFIASICKQQCSHIEYGDVIDGICTIVLLLACVVFICRFAQFSYDFITDRNNGSRIVPKTNLGIYEGFDLDLLLIAFGIIFGLIFAVVWIVAIPLAVIVGILFFARYLVRINRKLSKL